MGSFEESQFFDATDRISPETDSPYCHYDPWLSQPRSVEERRLNFIREMGFELEGYGPAKTRHNPEDRDVGGDFERAAEDKVAVEENCSSLSDSSIEDVGFCECCNSESERATSFSPCSCGARDFLREEDAIFDGSTRTIKNKLKWLSKLRKMASFFGRDAKDDVESDVLGRFSGRIKVRKSRKNVRELTGLFTGQDIKAHEGSISVMKFSPDGKYLASAGEDKVVKVWRVVEDERSNIIEIPNPDPSCAYFSVKRRPEKERIEKLRILRKTTEPACVILPPKVFRILEKPMHVFEGHDGEISDLAWSKNNRLLSSSTDKTVRMWSVGIDRCLEVFTHMDYVTCVHFSPVNDGYFVSGSIDGKIRVWDVRGRRVVEWAETRDMITAVSYRPDGLGGVIGFITGGIRFFNVSGGRIQLEAQMCLASKNRKKRPCKKITGFQFSPQDPSKVLVTCADSRVRIINGTDVIAKYKGFRNAGNHTSASFTSNGKHIISTSDDSNIYMWNHVESRPSSTRSFECFRAADASAAITWPGFKRGNGDDGVVLSSCRVYENTIHPSLAFSSAAYFSLRHDFHFDSKGSATWPEEKLPIPSEATNSCRNLSDSHAWGLVFVTGGWDGRIKSFHNYGLPLPL